jgi:hypothetical protein
MIQINSEMKASSICGAPKNFITCPQCHKKDWFYNYILRTCTGCDFYWGNVTALIDDINVRKQFHKDGEIIEKK